jgi:hypothetical protein
MDGLLSFFSHLILITAGLAVAALWIVIIVLVSVELYDTIVERFFETSEDEED